MSRLAAALWITRVAAVIAAAILCVMLSTACSRPQVIDYRYIDCIAPPIPPEPVYYPYSAVSVTGGLRLDPQSAVNLMKNVELLRGNRDELREIVSGMTGTGK